MTYPSCRVKHHITVPFIITPITTSYNHNHNNQSQSPSPQPTECQYIIYTKHNYKKSLITQASPPVRAAHSSDHGERREDPFSQLTTSLTPARPHGKSPRSLGSQDHRGACRVPGEDVTLPPCPSGLPSRPSSPDPAPVHAHPLALPFVCHRRRRHQRGSVGHTEDRDTERKTGVCIGR